MMETQIFTGQANFPSSFVEWFNSQGPLEEVPKSDKAIPNPPPDDLRVAAIAGTTIVVPS